MKCQQCDDEATIHLTETVEGLRREIHLCPPCARKAGLALPESPPALSLDSIVQGLILAHVGELVGTLAQAACPDCGLKYMGFRLEGRLGCPRDYEAFGAGLLPLLKRAHGATRHVGKIPRRRPARRGTGAGPRLTLRADLRRAVAREDYELAARLRDQLRLEDGDA